MTWLTATWFYIWKIVIEYKQQQTVSKIEIGFVGHIFLNKAIAGVKYQYAKGSYEVPRNY